MIRFLRSITLNGVQEFIIPADPEEEEGLDVESSLDMEISYNFKEGCAIPGTLIDNGTSYTMQLPGGLEFPSVPKDAVMETKEPMHQNSVMVIAPYKWEGLWVFDDPVTGLKREALISGMPEILERLLKEQGIADGEKGFKLIFSAGPFPGYHVEGTWTREEYGGNWYTTEKGEQGWLCSALFKYFPRAPQKIYARVEAKGN